MVVDSPSLPQPDGHSLARPNLQKYQPDSEMLDAQLQVQVQLCLRQPEPEAEAVAGVLEDSIQVGNWGRRYSFHKSHSPACSEPQRSRKTPFPIAGTIAVTPSHYRQGFVLSSQIEGPINHTTEPQSQLQAQYRRIQKLETRVRELKDCIYAADQLQGLAMDMMDMSL
jgi:hypothetical protein